MKTNQMNVIVLYQIISSNNVKNSRFIFGQS